MMPVPPPVPYAGQEKRLKNVTNSPAMMLMLNPEMAMMCAVPVFLKAC